MFKTLTLLAVVAWIALLAGCSGTFSSENKTTPVTSPAAPPSSNVVALTPSLGCIPSTQAQSSVGHTVTICGKVAEASYQPRSKGQPTFLNFDKPYPNHDFDALIWGENRTRFNPAPEVTFGAGKQVCVTGQVTTYQGKPQIEVTSPTNIKLC